MSLADIEDDEYVAVSRRKEKGLKRGLSLPSFGLTAKIIVLLIAFSLGILAAHYYTTPFICGLNEDYCTVQPKVCRDCFSAKKILESENQCLHKYVVSQEILDACSKT